MSTCEADIWHGCKDYPLRNETAISLVGVNLPRPRAKRKCIPNLDPVEVVGPGLHHYLTVSHWLALDEKKPANRYRPRAFGLLWTVLDLQMVPKAGLEPARVSPHAPQACASTNSTTWARNSYFCSLPVAAAGAAGAASAASVAFVATGSITLSSPATCWATGGAAGMLTPLITEEVLDWDDI